MTTKVSQADLILDRLKRGCSITPIEALRDFDCFRLGARIYDLKQAGHPIRAEIIENKKGKRYAKYSIATSKAVM